MQNLYAELWPKRINYLTQIGKRAACAGPSEEI